MSQGNTPHLFASYALIENTSDEVLVRTLDNGEVSLIGAEATKDENALEVVTRAVTSALGEAPSNLDVVYATILDGSKIVPVYRCTMNLKNMPSGFTWVSKQTLCEKGGPNTSFYTSMVETLNNRKNSVAA